MKRKVLSLVLVGMMTASMLAGCGQSSDTAANDAATDAVEAGTDTAAADASTDATADASSTPRNETLYFAGQQWGTINDWNPMSANSNNAMGVNQNNYSRILIYETLFMYNTLDGEMYPLLGKDWAWNDDMTELTVHMNPDAKWNDGTAVTANDVAYTFECHKKYESSKGADYSAYIDDVVASDDETVVFKAKLNDNGQAVNPLKVKEYLPQIYVMQKAYLEKVEDRNGGDADKIKQDTMKDLVSSGPYKPYYNDD